MQSVVVLNARSGRYCPELARPDYYENGGESPGQSHFNEMSYAYGLHRTVEKEVIEKLLDGYHPRTGEPLAQNHGKEDRRAAVDICYSVPKDVSAAWAAADEPERRRIEKALDKAVTEALNYLSDNFGYTRKGHGGYEREKVDLLVVKFVHRQSRGQDPQLHVHCLVLNTVLRRSDGQYSTVDLGPLLQTKKLGGAVFRSVLARELGIPLEADRFSFRVPGVPQELSEYWSSRAQEIERAAKERGLGGARAKEQITLETRRAKDERPLVEMKEKWREEARRHGFTAAEVKAIFCERCPELTPEQAAKVIDAEIEKVVERLTSQQAHFTREDIVRDVCIATVTQRIAPREIHERVTETLRGERFLSLGRHRNQERFTTREIFHETEARALEAAEKLSLRPLRAIPDKVVEAAIAAKPWLNAGQMDAVRTVCRGQGLTVIEGPPGSGKSTLFEVVRRAIELDKDGGTLIGLTPSNRAARELEKSAGIKCFTIDRFLYDQQRTVADTARHHGRMLVRAAFGFSTWRPPARLDVDRRTTIIFDESSMADNAKLSRALEAAEKAGCRVVLVGDHRQLQAIGPGGLFHELFLRARPEQKTALTEIVRQREAWARKAVEQIGRGEPAEALKAYEKAGRLTVSPTRDDAERKLIERWREGGVTNPQDNLILASTNAEVSRLNRHAQEVRREAGQLGLRSLRVGEEQIHEGDRVLFTETMKELGLVKADFATVTRLEQRTRKLTVQIDGQEKPVTFSLEKFDALRLGYAATTHRAQAMTVENTFVLFGGGMQSREMTYVQLSRARGECHLFADRQSAPTFSDLERAVHRSDEKLAAHTIDREADHRREERRHELAEALELSL